MTTKQTSSAKTTKLLIKGLENVMARLDNIESSPVNKTTSKVVKKTSEWVTLVESKKGERISLAPEDKTGKYESRGVVVSRYAKSIFIPANSFGQFVADVEVAYNKLQKEGFCPTA